MKSIIMAGIESAIAYLILLALWMPIKWFINRSQPDDKKIETHHQYIGILAVMISSTIRNALERM